MDPSLVLDLFWISATINFSAALFFACRVVASWAAGRYAEEAAGSWRRALFVLQDEKPWFLARFLVTLIQSAALCFAVIHLLSEGDVLRAPFIGLTTAGRAWFAINIGCYMYQLVQDALLQHHLPNYNVTFMHHLLAAIVYLVFLECRQNALCGTVGLLFLASAPFFEISDLLVELRVETHRAAYGVSLVLSGLAAFVLRLLLPAGFMVYSFTVASPFEMDMIVLSCFFFSIVFFGMLSAWFVYSAVCSFRRYCRNKSAWAYMKPLQTGKPHGLDIRQAKSNANGGGLASFTARRNDLNFLAPCSNTNLTSSKLTNTKTYHKIDIFEFLNTFEAHRRSAQCPPYQFRPALAALESVVTVGDQAADTNQTHSHSQTPSDTGTAEIMTGEESREETSSPSSGEPNQQSFSTLNSQP